MANTNKKNAKQDSAKTKKQGLGNEEAIGDIAANLEEGFEPVDIDIDSLDAAYEEYELGCELMQSDNPKTIKEAIKHLQNAIKLDPPFVDAQIEMLSAEKDTYKYIEKLRELETIIEPICLDDCGINRNDIFGEAWGCIEMRPLLRAKKRLADAYLDCGMLGLAQEKYEDILAWNENDNQGCREILIGIYAYFENKEKALALYERYERERSAWTLISLAVLHHKLGETNTSMEYIKELMKVIPETAEVIANGALDLGLDYKFESEYPGSYRPGSGEEVAIAIADLSYLLMGTPDFFGRFVEFGVTEYEKRLKKSKKSNAKSKSEADNRSKNKSTGKLKKEPNAKN